MFLFRKPWPDARVLPSRWILVCNRNPILTSAGNVQQAHCQDCLVRAAKFASQSISLRVGSAGALFAVQSPGASDSPSCGVGVSDRGSEGRAWSGAGSQEQAQRCTAKTLGCRSNSCDTAEPLRRREGAARGGLRARGKRGGGQGGGRRGGRRRRGQCWGARTSTCPLPALSGHGAVQAPPR